MKNSDFQKSIIERFDRLDAKVDELRTITIPGVQVDQAVLETRIKERIKANARMHGTIWGVITLAVSMLGLILSYVKR